MFKRDDRGLLPIPEGWKNGGNTWQYYCARDRKDWRVPVDGSKDKTKVYKLMDDPFDVARWLRINAHHLRNCGVNFEGDEIGAHPQCNYDHVKMKFVLLKSLSYDASSGAMGPPTLIERIYEHFGDSIQIDRAYLSYRKDMLRFERAAVPTFGIESKLPLRHFDIIGWSACYLPELQNFPRMIYDAGIPIWKEERDEEDIWPIILMGGAACRNIESVNGGKGGLVDAVHFGDADYAIIDYFESYMRLREEGASRKDIIEYWGKNIEGCYVPSYYTFRYKNPDLPRFDELEKIEMTGPQGVPETVKFTRVLDMDADDYHPMHQPILSWDSNPIGKGEVMISKSCNAFCSFCQESFSTKPYRERSVDKLVEDFGRSKLLSGSPTLQPYAFNSTMHSHFKTLVKEVTSKYGRIDQISQRVDRIAHDTDLVAIAAKVGSGSVTLGVEGGSQRLRDIANKSLTESEVIEAFEQCCKAGYTEIKLFFLVGLPGETEEDYEELLNLMYRFQDIRRQYGNKMYWRMSFSPLYCQAFSPFQFAECVTGKNPHRRVLGKVVETATKDKKIGFRVSTRAYDFRVCQLLHMADRRITNALVKVSLPVEAGGSGEILYYLSNKAMEKRWVEFLSEDGISMEEYFEEKDLDFVFPWDHLDAHVSKEFLYKLYLRALGAIDTPYCLDSKCFDCGACPDGEYKQKNVLNRELEPRLTIDDISPKVLKRHGVLRVGADIDKAHRGANPFSWKYALGRAFMHSGDDFVSVFNEVYSHAATNSGIADWYCIGRNYYDVIVNRQLTVSEQGNLPEKMNDHLRGIEVTGTKMYSADSKVLWSNKLLCYFYYKWPKKDFSPQDAERILNSLYNSDKEVIIREKIKGPQQLLKTQRRPINFSEEIISYAFHSVSPFEDNAPALRMLIDGKINPYELLVALYGKQKVYWHQNPVYIVDWYFDLRPKNRVKFWRGGDPDKMLEPYQDQIEFSAKRVVHRGTPAYDKVSLMTGDSSDSIEVDFGILSLEPHELPQVSYDEEVFSSLPSDVIPPDPDASRQALRVFVNDFLETGEVSMSVMDPVLKVKRTVGICGAVIPPPDVRLMGEPLCKQCEKEGRVQVIEKNVIGQYYHEDLCVSCAMKLKDASGLPAIWDVPDKFMKDM